MKESPAEYLARINHEARVAEKLALDTRIETLETQLSESMTIMRGAVMSKKGWINEAIDFVQENK